MEKARSNSPEPEGTAASPLSAPEKTVYTRAQRFLLLGCLAIGVLFDIYWRFDAANAWWLYGAFWLLALCVFVLFGGRRVLCGKTARALLVPAVFLCAWFGLDRAAPMRGYNFWMLPLLMLLFAVTSTRDIPVGREGVIARDALRAVFVLPFAGLRHFFGAAGSLFSAGGKGTAKRVGLGLIIGIPLTVAVLALLVSADDMMGRLLGSFFDRLELGAFARHACLILFPTALFFSQFFRLLWRREKELPAARSADWPASTLLVVLALPLLVYAFFTYVQFKYLFGGQLPAELTYAAYARKGFAELMIVACLNFTLFGLCMRYAAPNKGLRVVLGLLLAATALLLASAMMRLLLYIGAYRLTFNRIVPLWLMLYLCALVALCAVRLAKEKMPLMRIATFSFIYWYILLNLPDWTRLVACYNNRP